MGKVVKYLVLVVASILLGSQSFAATILGGEYDTSQKLLTLHVAYDGQTANHKFQLNWEPCQVMDGVRQVTARLIDLDGSEFSEEEYEQMVQFDLSGLNCSPGFLTVRSGRWSSVTLEL